MGKKDLEEILLLLEKPNNHDHLRTFWINRIKFITSKLKKPRNG